MHHFPWLRNRTTEHRKAGKARNTKENRRSKEFSTVSKPHVARRSSQRDTTQPNIKNSETLGNAVFSRVSSFFDSCQSAVKTHKIMHITNTQLTYNTQEKSCLMQDRKSKENRCQQTPFSLQYSMIDDMISFLVLQWTV